MDVLTFAAEFWKYVLSKVVNHASAWDQAEHSVWEDCVLSTPQHWATLPKGLTELVTLIYTYSSLN